MPLSNITCPNCNATLKPKTPTSEGTRLKCPRCGTPFTVQAASDTAGPRTQRKSRPAVVDDEDNPEITEAIDDEADEEREERPTRKRRSPARKKGVPVWVWITAGVGALLLLCCGVSAPLGYLALSGRGLLSSTVNHEHLDRIKRGMTEAQVKEIMGGEPTETMAVENIGKNETWKSGQDSISVYFQNGKAAAKSWHFSLPGGGVEDGHNNMSF